MGKHGNIGNHHGITTRSLEKMSNEDLRSLLETPRALCWKLRDLLKKLKHAGGLVATMSLGGRKFLHGTGSVDTRMQKGDHFPTNIWGFPWDS